MTPALLVQATGCRPDIAEVYAPLLDSALATEGVLAQAGFIGQCAYESGLFTRLEEDLYYSSGRLIAVWPSRFYLGDPVSGKVDAEQCGNNPEAVANVVYCGRMGNGDLASGDGWRYRGRGLCQLTGLENYRALQDATGLQVVDNPDLLSEPAGAVAAARWFWTSKKMTQYALLHDWVGLTRCWNGGLEGLPDRAGLINRALTALKSGG